MISVIIPLYNNAEDINTAISSVYNTPDTEIIVVDDCSTDNPDLSQWPNIKLFKTDKNSGPFVAMNIGLDNAKGEYICRLDSDDCFSVDKIQNDVAYLDNHPDKVACRSRSDRAYNYAEVTMMFRKSIIDKIGYFDNVRFGADSEFVHRILTVYGGDSIGNINDVTYFTKNRPQSLTNSPLTCINTNIRRIYKDSYLQWHKNNKHLYICKNHSPRQFWAPTAML